MSLLNAAYLVIAAVCFTVAVQHLMVAVRLRERLVHVTFALTAMAAATDSLLQRQFVRATTPAEMETLFAWGAVSICAFLGLMACFVALTTGCVRRWLLVVELGLLAATAAIDFVLPGTPAFMDVHAVEDVVLPWGESMKHAVADPSPWRVIGDVANLGFMALLLDTTIRLARRGRKREAALTGGSLLVLGLTVLAIIPMDLGLVILPPLHPFAFLLIVAGTSWELSDRVARTTALTRERGEVERSRNDALAELQRSFRDLEALRRRLEEENLLLREATGQEEPPGSVVGSSPGWKYVLHKVKQGAPTTATVMLSGETGVGKEVVARLIHQQSERATRPFVVVNCAGLPASLIESELFGHERGAFTGADRQRRGRFETANGGTIFLDEVGDLPLDLQPKLLRALQEGQVERVGADRPIDVDVRVIAATNRDLRAEVAAGRFRQDLYYRLDVYPITIPPLRDRVEDIPALVEHFVREVAGREGIAVREIPKEVLRHLARHRWPGNVRELHNVVERAVLRCADGVLRLTESLVIEEETTSPGEPVRGRPRPTLDEVQRVYILQVLRDCDGQIAGRGGVAEVLGLHPNTLRSRMRKLGIGESSVAVRGSTSLPLDH